MEGRRCPACAEEIASDAVRCPYCRSRLSYIDARGWHRDHPGRKLGGVCVAVARSLALPVGPVRAAFLLASFVHLLGPIVYLALWLTIPYRVEGDSILERALATAVGFVDKLWHDETHPGEPGAGHGPMR
jgi:phage shock protein PspC (stress-responsive transcriptional regulator)